MNSLASWVMNMPVCGGVERGGRREGPSIQVQSCRNCWKFVHQQAGGVCGCSALLPCWAAAWVLLSNRVDGARHHTPVPWNPLQLPQGVRFKRVIMDESSTDRSWDPAKQPEFKRIVFCSGKVRPCLSGAAPQLHNACALLWRSAWSAHAPLNSMHRRTACTAPPPSPSAGVLRAGGGACAAGQAGRGGHHPHRAAGGLHVLCTLCSASGA